MAEIIFKKYSYKSSKFSEINSQEEKNEVACTFCAGTFFTLIEKGGQEYLECRCGNKISNKDLNFVRHSKIEKYQKLLESIDELKDDFLFNIRAENKNTSNERVGIFVDIQNMYYGAKDSFNKKIDFRKLLDNILRERKLVTANAYLIDSTVNNKNFINFLKQLGYTLMIKDLKVRQDGSAKGNADIEMVIDILNEKDKIDTVALVSGDGDFVPLVEFLKSKNIKVEVYSFSIFKNSTAFDLKQSASQFFEIDKNYLLEKKELQDA